MSVIQLYTDGSSRPNGESGCAYVIVDGRRIIKKSFTFRLSNSSRMEILAVILGLNGINPKLRVRVYTDYKPVVDYMTSGCLKETNNDLWGKLTTAAGKYEQADFAWVKSKSGNLYHSMADDLAFASGTAAKSLIDREYELSQVIRTILEKAV